MGDMGDIYREGKEIIKKRRESRMMRFEPWLEAVGAEWKSQAIWEYKGWLCYPSKGYAMLKKNNRIRKPLRFILPKIEEKGE